LIALQINNWNEWRKEREKETKVLIQLAKNLNVNSKQLDNWIKYNQNASFAGDVVIAHFQNELSYHDSLAVYFWRAMLNWNENLSTVGYEALKNTGFDILKNDVLQEEILDLFEVYYESYHESMRWGDEDVGFIEKYLDEQFLRVSNDTGGGLRYIPFDSERIMEDQYLYSIYVKRQRQRSFYNKNMKGTIEDNQRVLNLIKDELGE